MNRIRVAQNKPLCDTGTFISVAVVVGGVIGLTSGGWRDGPRKTKKTLSCAVSLRQLVGQGFYHMRALLIFFSFFVSLVSAESEVLTLNDGRVLTGVYDEDKNTITVASGKVTAIITVKAGDIKSRKLLNPPPPERDFIAEASRFDEQQKAAEEQRKQQRIKEQQEKAESNKIIAQINAERQLKANADREEARQAADAAAEERAKRQAEAEEDLSYIAKRQADAKEDFHQAAMRQTEADEQGKAREGEKESERKRAKIAHVKMMEEIQRKTDIEQRERMAREESSKRWDLFFVVCCISLVVYVWMFPSILSHYRRFEKRWEITTLLIFTLVAGFGVPVISATISGVRPDFGGPGIGITAIGWLGALTWVLIASKPRIKEE